MRYRRVLEALRCGVVPSDRIQEWTFGRKAEIQTIMGWLENEGSATMVIEGDYGSGKSHLLHFLADRALGQNYVVAMTGLNPLETPPAFPKRVYRSIARHLRFGHLGQRGGLRELLTAIADLFDDSLKGHVILDPIIGLIRKHKDTEPVWEYIMGGDVDRCTLPQGLPSLPDHTTAANVYCYLLSGIAAYAEHYLNVKGLLVLFDEMELVRTYRYNYELKRGINFLDGLSRTAFDEEGMGGETVVKDNNVYRGQYTHLVYSAYTRVPYSFTQPAFLKLVVAITPGFMEFFGRFMFNHKLTLDPIGFDNVRQLLEKTFLVYKALYNIWLSGPERQWVYKSIFEKYLLSTRLAVKSSIESMDYKRYYRDATLLDLEKYRGLG